MKKLLCVMLICALCACALAGCNKQAAPEEAPDADFAPAQANPGVTAVPEEGGHGEEDQSAALAEMPTLAPAERLEDDTAGDAGASDDYYSIDALISQPDATDEPEFNTYVEETLATVRPGTSVIDPSALQFSALADTTMGFTFNYPTSWVNIPGIYTVCYREAVEPGDFPARVAITGKLLVHSPEGTVLTDELMSYVRTIYKQYDASSFQLGTPNTQDTFMGKLAVSNTYLAYSGETEVKGFIIGTSVGRRMYVFHFCASYEDYAAMERLMRYMLNSVALVEKEK